MGLQKWPSNGESHGKENGKLDGEWAHMSRLLGPNYGRGCAGCQGVWLNNLTTSCKTVQSTSGNKQEKNVCSNYGISQQMYGSHLLKPEDDAVTRQTPPALAEKACPNKHVCWISLRCESELLFSFPLFLFITPIVVSILFPIIPKYPQCTIVVSIFFSI